MANETLETIHSTAPHPAEALLNALPVQPVTSVSNTETFKNIFAADSDADDLPVGHKVLNVLLYVVLASAVFATVRIFWTSAKEMLAG